MKKRRVLLALAIAVPATLAVFLARPLLDGSVVVVEQGQPLLKAASDVRDAGRGEVIQGELLLQVHLDRPG